MEVGDAKAVCSRLENSAADRPPANCSLRTRSGAANSRRALPSQCPPLHVAIPNRLQTDTKILLPREIQLPFLPWAYRQLPQSCERVRPAALVVRPNPIDALRSGPNHGFPCGQQHRKLNVTFRSFRTRRCEPGWRPDRQKGNRIPLSFNFSNRPATNR
jgi:hypothetical protein